MDSNGHLPSGITSGTMTDLGDFDQCIRIKETFDNNNIIEGKYCLLTISPLRNGFNISELNKNKEIEMKWLIQEYNDWLQFDKHFLFSNGICFPSNCNQKEIKSVLNKFFPFLKHFVFEIDFCQTSEEPNYGSDLLVAMSIIVVCLVLVIIGTFADIFLTFDSFGVNALKCFSIPKNIKILFKISAEKSKTEYKLQFIHGLRVFGTVWVILAHSSAFILVTFLVKVSPFARYPDDAIESSKSILSQYIMNASLAVQIFFIMSGFLTVYSTLSKKKLEVSFFQFVILRWLRFSPPLIGMMCLTISLQKFGSGPLFHPDLLKPYIRPCYEKWWAHLFYFINWFDLREMCGIQTWYLGADFQMHIISFIVIFFFYKNQNISYYFAYLMVILGAIIPVLIVGLGIAGIPRVDVIFKPKYDIPGKETTLFFFGTHIHLIAYFFGSILGFALLNRKFISISKVYNRLIWCLVIGVSIITPVLTYPILQQDLHPVNFDVSNAILFSSMIIVWSLCMVWIIYNCAINRALILSKILSANFLHPLSRLSFCAYLTHLMIIWFNVQQIRHPIQINVITIAQSFCTVLVETFIMALFLYLTFEAPFVNLIKEFLLSNNKRNQNNENIEENYNSVESQNSMKLKNLSNNNNNNL